MSSFGKKDVPNTEMIPWSCTKSWFEEFKLENYNKTRILFETIILNKMIVKRIEIKYWNMICKYA